MKKLTAYMLATAISLALGSAAYAQARHDEKPHGSAKPAPSATADTPATDRAPGRHDERPHGKKDKAKTKTADATKTEAKKDAPAK